MGAEKLKSQIRNLEITEKQAMIWDLNNMQRLENCGSQSSCLKGGEERQVTFIREGSLLCTTTSFEARKKT
jgi:hypothetical protein